MSTWLRRNRGYIVVTLINTLIAGLLAWWTRWVPPADFVIVTPAPTLTPTPAPLRVYVSGAVAYPDVYTLPAGALVRDALGAAGGVTDEADLSQINLAQELRDQQHIHVPAQGEARATAGERSSSGGELGGVSTPLDLNSATAAELETLPGIGPALAGRIVAYREEHGPFTSVEDLLQVSGIGPATLERLRPLVYVP